MSQPNVNKLCELMNTTTNANFHFVLHEGTHASVDSFAHQLEQQQLNHNWYNRGHVTLLIDASADPELPMRYLLEAISDYNRSYDGLEAPSLTIAVVHHPDTEIPDVYHMFASLLEPPAKVKYFTNVDDAQEWLA